MKKLVFVSLVALSLFSQLALAATQTIQAKVNGMVCAFCAQQCGVCRKPMMSTSI